MNLVTIHFGAGDFVQLRISAEATAGVLNAVSARELNTFSVGPTDDPAFLFVIDKITRVQVQRPDEQQEDANNG